jgi:hypothetical protein
MMVAPRRRAVEPGRTLPLRALRSRAIPTAPALAADAAPDSTRAGGGVSVRSLVRRATAGRAVLRIPLAIDAACRPRAAAV